MPIPLRLAVESFCRLTEARRRNLHVGPRPNFLKSGVDCLGLFVLVLQMQAAGQAVERPAVIGLFGLVVAIDPFGISRFPDREQSRAERMTDGMNPIGWLGVTELVFKLNCGMQFGDASGKISTPSENLPVE